MGAISAMVMWNDLRPMPPKRTLILWGVLVLATLLLTSFCSLSMSRDGLYNNHEDPQRAMREHEAAWRQLKIGNEISRLQMLALLRRFDGKCRTQEINWVTVQLDQRLDPSLQDADTVIECFFRIRSRGPGYFIGYHSWTTELVALSGERLRVENTTHRTRGMDW
jgi:hypothetical protein